MDRYFGVILLLSLTGSVAGITTYYMDHMCDTGKHIQDAIRIRLTSRSSYNPNMNCQLNLITTSDSRFMFYFKDLDIEHSTECTDDYLDVLDGNSLVSPYVAGIKGSLCGSYMDQYVYLTSNNTLLLHFVSDGSSEYSGFDMVITSYHTGRCYVSNYECDNGRCISNTLSCNGYNPCGDHSDCPSAADARIMNVWEKPFIAVTVVAVVLLIIATLAILAIVKYGCKEICYTVCCCLQGVPYRRNKE